MKMWIAFISLLLLGGCNFSLRMSTDDTSPKKTAEERTAEDNTRRLSDCKKECAPYKVQSFGVYASGGQGRVLCMCQE